MFPSPNFGGCKYTDNILIINIIINNLLWPQTCSAHIGSQTKTAASHSAWDRIMAEKRPGKKR